MSHADLAGYVEPVENPPAAAEPTIRCDHICLLDAGHVERGEPHFYGYENPSPRGDKQP